MKIIKEIFKNKILLLFAVVIMISLGFTLKSTFDMVHYNVNSVNLNDIEVTQAKKGSAYNVKAEMVLDMIASNDDESIAYFLLATHNGDYEGYYIVKTESMQEQFKNVCRSTFDVLTGKSNELSESFFFIADADEADENVIGYAEEWFDADENPGAKDYLCPFMLVQCEYDFTTNIIELIVSGVIFSAAVIGLFIYRKKKYDRQMS